MADLARFCHSKMGRRWWKGENDQEGIAIWKGEAFGGCWVVSPARSLVAALGLQRWWWGFFPTALSGWFSRKYQEMDSSLWQTWQSERRIGRGVLFRSSQ